MTKGVRNNKKGNLLPPCLISVLVVLKGIIPNKTYYNINHYILVAIVSSYVYDYS